MYLYTFSRIWIKNDGVRMFFLLYHPPTALVISYMKDLRMESLVSRQLAINLLAFGQDCGPNDSYHCCDLRRVVSRFFLANNVELVGKPIHEVEATHSSGS